MLNKETTEQKIIRAILSIAETSEVHTEEIKELQQMIARSKQVESHPNYDALIELGDKFPANVQKEIIRQLEDASYDEIEGLYE